MNTLRAFVQFPRSSASGGRSSWLWVADSVPSCLASSSGLPRTAHGPSHIPVVRQCPGRFPRFRSGFVPGRPVPPRTPVRRRTRGGGTVHPAIPDLRRTYGSVYARFTLGSTPVLRFGFVGFASGLVGIRTGLVRISGFVPDFVPKKSNESPLGATWGLF